MNEGHVTHFATDSGPGCPVCATPEGRGIYSYRTLDVAGPYLVAHCHMCGHEVRLPTRFSEALTVAEVVMAHRSALSVLRG